MRKVLLSLVAMYIVAAGTTGFGANGRASKVNLNVLAGLGTTAGDYGGTFLAGVSFQVDQSSEFRLGLDSGILFGSGTGLPILVSGTIPMGSGKTRAYFTGSVGPVLGIGDPTVGAGVFDAGPTGDGVRLAILLRPGVAFQIADAMDFVAEFMMGGLTGIFYIGPNIGVHVNL